MNNDMPSMKYNIPVFNLLLRLLIFQLLLNYHQFLIMVVQKYKKLEAPSILIIN